MYMRALAMTVLLLAVPASRADEAYTIKTTRDKKTGDTTLITKSANSTSTTVMTDEEGDVVKDEKEVMECRSVVQETILSIQNGAKHADKVALKFEKVTGSKDGDDVDYGLTGKTIVAERRDRAYDCRVEGGGLLSDEALVLLQADFLKINPGPLQDELILPAKPVRVGESWDCNLEGIAQVIDREMQGVKIDAKKAKATGTLLKVTKVNGCLFGEFQVTMVFPLAKDGKFDDADLKFQDGSQITMNYTYAGCLDGSKTESRMTGIVEMKTKGTINISGSTVTLKGHVTMKGDETRKDVPEN
jgi:hypothetical protein